MNDYHYINDDGIECYDYCESCNHKIKQIVVSDDGQYGCEFCKRTDSIIIVEVKQ